jgi:hypothetical protein
MVDFRRGDCRRLLIQPFLRDLICRGDNRGRAINRWAMLICPSGAILNERNRRNEEVPVYWTTVRMFDTVEAPMSPLGCCQERFLRLPE